MSSSSSSNGEFNYIPISPPPVSEKAYYESHGIILLEESPIKDFLQERIPNGWTYSKFGQEIKADGSTKKVFCKTNGSLIDSKRLRDTEFMNKNAVTDDIKNVRIGQDEKPCIIHACEKFNVLDCDTKNYAEHSGCLLYTSDAADE